MREFWGDTVHAFRLLGARRNRVGTVIVFVALVVTIGVGTSIASFAEALLLRPLPYPAASQLVSLQLIQKADLGRSVFGRTPTWGLFKQWQTNARAFSGIAAYTRQFPVLTGAAQAQRVQAVAVTSNMFTLLAARPVRGRVFDAASDVTGAAPEVVLSDRIWSGQFGRDTTIIGRSISLSGKRFAVVGIMPSGFRVPNSIPEVRKTEGEVWIPIGTALSTGPPAARRSVTVLGRLSDGATTMLANADLARILASSMQDAGASSVAASTLVPQAVPLRSLIVGQVRKPIIILLSGAICVLLIASASVSALLFARGIERQREMAVRAALGATGARLARQLMAESLALAIPSGVGGAILAVWGVPLLARWGGSGLPDVAVTLDASVLLVGLAMTLIATLASGLAPAVRIARGVNASGLKEATSGAGHSTQSRRLMEAIVVSQVAVTVLLVAAAGVFTTSFLKLTTGDRGYDTSRTAVASLGLPAERYPTPADRSRFAEMVVRQLKQVPEISSVSLTTDAPMVSSSKATVVGIDDHARGTSSPMDVWGISTDFFLTMGIPIHLGRTVNGLVDGEAVIDENAARRLYPGSNALGRRLKWGDGDSAQSLTIVGISGNLGEIVINTRANSNTRLSEPRVYRSLGTSLPASIRFVISSPVPSRLASAIQRVVRGIDPDIPIDIDTFEQLMSERFSRERLVFLVTVGFAAMTLLIAVSGIYGVMSQAVSQRMREFSLRRAFGATSLDIIRITSGHALLMALSGAALGMLGALACRNLIRSSVFEVSLGDWRLLGGTVGVLVCSALVAALFPTIRASRADPASALRE